MKVLVTVPEGIFRNKFFNEENKKILEDNFDVTYNELGRDYTEEELKEVIKGYEIIITGWGTPSFIDTCALQETDGIKMIAHTAGSIGFSGGGEPAAAECPAIADPADGAAFFIHSNEHRDGGRSLVIS